MTCNLIRRNGSTEATIDREMSYHQKYILSAVCKNVKISVIFGCFMHILKDVAHKGNHRRQSQEREKRLVRKSLLLRRNQCCKREILSKTLVMLNLNTVDGLAKDVK